VVYVATAHFDPMDLEWQARIAQHQRRRPSNWITQHAPVELSAMIRSISPSCLLIDSLGTWLANLLDLDAESWKTIEQEFIQTLVQYSGDIILVAEETGWGVVPAYPVGRVFRDRLGHLVRKLGAIADSVYLVTGGHVLNLSTLGTPLDKAIDLKH
jgi:adenosylcobinamide kinase/adenosylcobinamide-phosphate guanylyltransferase